MKKHMRNTSIVPIAYLNKTVIYVILRLMKYSLILLQPYYYLLFLNDVIVAKQLEHIWLILGMYGLTYVGKYIVSLLIQKQYNNIFPKIKIDTKNQLFDSYDRIEIVDLEQYTPGEMMQCLQKDAPNISALFEKKVECFISLICTICTAVILLKLNFIMSIISFAMLPVSFWMTRLIKNKSNIEYDRQRQFQGIYNDFMIHSFYYWKEIKSYCQEEIQNEQFSNHWKNMGEAFKKTHMCWFFNRTFLAFKDVFLTKMGLYLLGGFMVIYGYATVPILLSFMDYYKDLVESMLSFVDIIMKQGEQEQSLKRINEILDKKANEYLYTVSSFEFLEFRNVTFSYSEESEPIFRDFNLLIKKGESVAIIGESGCGKSTLVKLMAGFLYPDKGEILLNGYPINKVDRKSLYGVLGFLMQETTLFNLSIRDNLILGKIDALPNEIESACEKANILSFINELPEKLEMQIGENGSGISGGQKQRLAMARLYLQDPDVIIFDEATSALDYKNEYEILDLLLENQKKTLVMITHRDTLINRFDRIIKIG